MEVEAPLCCMIVDHGSRSDAANAALEAAAARMQEAAPRLRVEAAHMELASPSLAEAVDRCAADGVKRIVIVPWFLAPGRHSREDIPRLAAEAAARHPGLVVTVSAPLGPDPMLATLALRRFEEALKS